MIHFEYFPQIEYSGELATNLMVRAKIRDLIKNNTFVYYSYDVKDSERPDILSHKYYGNVTYTWAIFYANDIFDPLTEWPRTTEQFGQFIIKKYGTIEKAMTTPHHYMLENTYVIDKTTFEDVNIPAAIKKMVTEYEHEFNLNEERRHIKIIDAIYIRQISNELINIFK